ncbi:hypothetical protein RUND412_004913 [Rhizina undulata]
MWTSGIAVLCMALPLALAGPSTATKHSTVQELLKVAEEFVSAEIVPDVVPAFNLVALAYLTFPYSNGSSETIFPGLRIGRNDSQVAPVISITDIPPSSENRYVGVIVAPDAPTNRRSIRHYLASDLTIEEPSGYVSGARLLSNATFGSPAANDYLGPNPPVGSGPHRYIFFLYNQPEVFDYSFLNLTDRTSFNISSFAETTGLGAPLAGTYFFTEVVAITAT